MSAALVGFGVGAAWVFGAVVACWPLLAGNNYVLSLGIFFFINLLLIGGLNLTMGYGGQISLCQAGFYGLGAYLSGYSGQYGIRYDNTGWTDATGTNQNFTLASGGAPTLEHAMLTGETVTDGPETIPTQASHEISTTTTADGYTTRRWDFRYRNYAWKGRRKNCG